MTNEEIKKLETELWGAADELRANSKLTAAEYKDPVLGLILLRYAQNKFEEAKKQIEETLAINPRTGKKRELTKDDLIGAGAMYLQAESQYEYLANLPESADIAEAVNNAMQLIESDYKDLQGILPKNYQEFDADLLRSLIRVFNKDSVRNIKGDVFGRIYEFFLMKFSMSGAGAQEGGEFFTPPSLVQLIVNFIEPDHGIIHDPACGSGGMFVQTGHFIKNNTNKQVNEAITVYGTELKSNNVRLAKMNLAIHGIEGKIIENNSFYSNPHDLTGKCDFVMANPPFNVKKIDKNKDYVKTDPRLPFGVPKADNGNYMWIQYFNSYLNEKGRAGFVMPSSATDAGYSEKFIREKLIESGDVDIIVSISNNFFYTRSLPCHLWFFDKDKLETNKDKILMIDARNTYRVVSSTINDFSDGQLLNLTTIVQLYRGNTEAILQAEEAHKQALKEQFEIVNGHYIELAIELKQLSIDLKNKDIIIPEKIDFSNIDNPQAAKDIFNSFEKPAPKVSELIASLEKEIAKITIQADNKEIEKNIAAAKLKPFKDQLIKLNKALNFYFNIVEEFIKEIRQRVGDWKTLLNYFPDNKYVDIPGLCKIVSKNEVVYNEYSLTPGRYVGYTFKLDNNFDFNNELKEKKSRIQTLHNSISDLWLSSLSKFDNHTTLTDYSRVNFEELIEFQIGGGWGNEYPNKEFTEPAFVIRGTDFDSVELGEISNVPFRYHKKSNLKSRKLRVGDIIFEVSGGSSNSGVAKSLLITNEILEKFNGNVMCASFCKLIRLKDVELSAYIYLYLRFLRDIKATEIYEIRSASNIINYNFKAFLKFQEIIKPNNGFVTEFNEFVVPIMSSIIRLGIQTRELKESLTIIFPGLMKSVK